MIKCYHCGGNAEGSNRILLTVDGDFACSTACKVAYEKRRDHFFNDIVHREEKTRAWLMGEIE